jgi:hypothetical protein
LQYTGQGIYRGGGYQGIAFGVIVSVYYLLALPTALCLMFLTDLGTLGELRGAVVFSIHDLYSGGWIGLGIGITIASMTFFITSNFVINWTKAAKGVSVK